MIQLVVSISRGKKYLMGQQWESFLKKNRNENSRYSHCHCRNQWRHVVKWHKTSPKDANKFFMRQSNGPPIPPIPIYWLVCVGDRTP